jgi:hypothetical protein
VIEASGTTSIGYDVRGLLSQAERLARTEVELALAKGRESVGETMRHLVMLVVAGVFALGGTAFLLHAVYAGLSIRLDSWLAALLTAVVAFVGAFVSLRIGVSQSRDDADVAEADTRRGVAVAAR